MNPSLLICPNVESYSAMDECIHKFQSAFWMDGPTLELPALPMGCPLVSELEALVEPKKIWTFGKGYPKDKACGLDSIHTILLYSLQAS